MGVFGCMWGCGGVCPVNNGFFCIFNDFACRGVFQFYSQLVSQLYGMYMYMGMCWGVWG